MNINVPQNTQSKWLDECKIVDTHIHTNANICVCIESDYELITESVCACKFESS